MSAVEFVRSDGVREGEEGVELKELEGQECQ